MDGSSIWDDDFTNYGAMRRREQEPSITSIENAFAKLKALLRTKAERTIAALWDTIGSLLDLFTPDECATTSNRLDMTRIKQDVLQDNPNSPQKPERTTVEAISIDSRDDVAQWAIDRTKSILTDQGSDLATATRTGEEAQMGEAATALGQAIIDALIDTFDGLVDDG